MLLIELFNTIQQPAEIDTFQFSALPIPNCPNHRIAKDKEANPILLLSVFDKEVRANLPILRLQNVKVQFDIKCNIQQNESIIEKIFTVVSFVGKEAYLITYFLKLCSTLIEDIGNEPSIEETRKEISHFIELFRLVTEPQIKTVQGLWAELFLISISKNPEYLIKCWHCFPEEKFDFNNGEERLEVKSSSNSLRIHNFSLVQLNPPKDATAIIASIFVSKSSTGKSISKLAKEIADSLSKQHELIEKLRYQIALTLGKSINEALDLCFDFHLAKDSLRYFRTEDIPRISTNNVPPLVIDVHFKSDLTNIEPINLKKFAESSEFFDSI
jgi:hypothetical protein